MAKPQRKAAGRPEVVPVPSHTATGRHPLDPPPPEITELELDQEQTADERTGPPVPVGATTLPEPYQTAGTGTLDDREQADLAACETAIDTLRMAFWAAGKALQVIRDGRLYRATHPTFEEYCEDRWEMGRSYANRLIRGWPLTEILVPIGTKSLTESHVRELLPLAEAHGNEAALTVYQTVVEVDGVRVTAGVLKGAVEALPADRFDPAEAVEQIRAYLARSVAGQDLAERVEATATETFTAEAGRLRTILQRVAKRDIVRSAATENPDEVKKVVTELRALLDEIERTAQ